MRSLFDLNPVLSLKLLCNRTQANGNMIYSPPMKVMKNLEHHLKESTDEQKISTNNLRENFDEESITVQDFFFESTNNQREYNVLGTVKAERTQKKFFNDK